MTRELLVAEVFAFSGVGLVVREVGHFRVNWATLTMDSGQLRGDGVHA